MTSRKPLLDLPRAVRVVGARPEMVAAYLYGSYATTPEGAG